MHSSATDDLKLWFKMPVGTKMVGEEARLSAASNGQAVCLHHGDPITLELEGDGQVPEVWEIWLVKTDHNLALLPHWERFLHDFFAMPVRQRHELSGKRPPLIVLPECGPLSTSMEKEILSFVEGGSGLLVTGLPSARIADAFGIGPTPRYAAEMVVCAQEQAVAPLQQGEIAPFEHETYCAASGEPMLASIVGNEKILRRLRWLSRKMMVLVSLLPFCRTAAYGLYGTLMRLVTRLPSIHKQACVATIQRGKGKIAYWGFDPLRIMRDASMHDESPTQGALHAWSMKPLLSCITDVAESIFLKPLWDLPGVPLIYSIDTEASIHYWNQEKGHCSDVRATATEAFRDTKLSHCLKKCARVLEDHGLIGSFHLCTGGMHDDEDRKAVADVSKLHEITVHMGGDGDHGEWAKRCGERAYVRNNLSDAVDKIVRVTGTKPIGIRYPAWYRTALTHDFVEEMGFVYDTSTWVSAPYSMIPFRMSANKDGLPSGLWQIPCMQNWEFVKRRRSIIDKLGGYWALKVMKQYLDSSLRNQSLVSICDHDFAFGVDEKHLHNHWQPNSRMFSILMRWLQRAVEEGDLFPVTSRDFMKHYMALREPIVASVDVNHMDAKRMNLQVRFASDSKDAF